MRTVTETYEIYKFEELDEKAKDEVKRWYLDDDCRPQIFLDGIMCHLSSLFGSCHDMKVQFDLGYCQGDGLNIYGSVSAYDVIRYIKEHRTDVLTEEEMNTILKYAEDTDGIELPYNHHYSYCRAGNIRFAGEWIEQLEYAIEEEYAAVDSIDKELIFKFENIVRKIFFDICKEYEKSGYEFFYEVSDEELQEVCELNGWEFYKDGEFYC